MALSCEIHRAFIYDRGGANRLFEITPVTSVSWERVRDATSQAKVSIADPGEDCQRRMLRVHPNRHELVIFRGSDRVWEGPISLMAWHIDRIEVTARDVLYYAHRTVMRAGYDNAHPNIVTTIQRSINVLGELARKEALDPPINVLPHVTAYTTPGDARTSKVTIPYQSTVLDDIDAMAWRSGMDYTVVGRRILLFDTHTVFYTTPQVTEADFLAEIVVTQYGLEHATWAVSLGPTGNAGIGYAEGTTLGVDPFYGEWEVADSAYDEDGTAAPTEAALEEQATRTLHGRNPVPLHVRIPDNSRINPNGVLKLEHLVPGVRIPLRATLLTLEVAQIQKLNRVSVTEDGENGEAISVTLYPASINDVAPEA